MCMLPPLLTLLAAAVAEGEPSDAALPSTNDQLSGAEIGAAMRTTSDIELCNGREACAKAHDAAVAHIQRLGNGYEPQDGRETKPLPEVAGSSWWSTGAAPESFEVSKLNSIYNASGYYRGYGVYVTPHYVPLMMRFCGQVLGRRVQSVLELGNGGGAFTVVYRRLGVDIVTVEGTALGYASTLKRGIPLERVVQHDLRLPLRLRRRFDAVILTEVVEHVEPVFSSTIVLNAVLHSDVVWFSYKHNNSRARAYLNHPNEQPGYVARTRTRVLRLTSVRVPAGRKLWVSLFNFYGFKCVPLPELARKLSRWRGDFIAYNTSNRKLLRLAQDDFNNFSTAVD